eukprot:Gb_28074 [translate_table: standard]
MPKKLSIPRRLLISLGPLPLAWFLSLPGSCFFLGHPRALTPSGHPSWDKAWLGPAFTYSPSWMLFSSLIDQRRIHSQDKVQLGLAFCYLFPRCLSSSLFASESTFSPKTRFCSSVHFPESLPKPP